MTIREVKLSDKFHIWVAATNLMMEEINREIVLEAKQQLKTLDKSTLVNAINELFDTKLNRGENVELSDNEIITKAILANTKIQVGQEGYSQPCIEFYDDTTNIYRKFIFDGEKQAWVVEDKDGDLVEVLTTKSTFDGNQQTILVKRLPDEEFKSYAGPEGSLSYNLATKEVRVHDGFTPGGISLLTHTLVITQVQTNQNDPTAGYLIDKIQEGDGIRIRAEQIDGNIKVLIDNTLCPEFDNVVANTYIKRDENGKVYKSMSNTQVVNDLKLGQIHTQVLPFNEVILLEDQVYSYFKSIDDVTVMSFDTGILTYMEGTIEFEVIMNVKSLTEIRFADDIKWHNGIVPEFNQIADYVVKFKSYDKGMTWLGKVDGIYI